MMNEVRILNAVRSPEYMDNTEEGKARGQPHRVDWNSRFSATQRTYVYRLLLCPDNENDDDDDDDDEEDDDDGDSSSDEEPDMLDSSRTSSEDETSSEHEAPVLDLFAGNFAFGDDAPGDLPFSDFANFDDAFADTPNVDDGPEKEEKNNFDSIFGDVKSRDILLDNFDEPPENGLFEEPATVGAELSTGETEAV
mmetsp:Transcript_4495/g.10916  ORF Transcript_4495/g.10916 Transcript_4495/m.10916 type:complete len:195 (-) Transcript_4495:56-640(-)